MRYACLRPQPKSFFVASFLILRSKGIRGKPGEGYVSDKFYYLEVSINGGTPIAGWFIRENPTNMDDLGLPPISGNLYLDSLSSQVHDEHVYNVNSFSR